MGGPYMQPPFGNMQPPFSKAKPQNWAPTSPLDHSLGWVNIRPLSPKQKIPFTKTQVFMQGRRMIPAAETK
jgi:hypothetical protein